MRKVRIAAILLGLTALLTTSAVAQQTAGNITGRVLDAQGAAVPGATITATNAATGFNRTAVSDAEGIYRLASLPVGNYDVLVELPGFTTVEQKGIILNVGQTLSVDATLKVASVAETITVTGESPLIEATASSVGGVVDVGRIESLPLNGRQFANLAVTIPGVGLGFHSDPTKSTQYSPQINGGNGRNVNYQIDGGDNNDDTVGGLLQLFPLEAIQEFNLITSRSKAEYGRSNGGVMNIVTKSGTNRCPADRSSRMFRDTAMNAKTETEKRGGGREAGLPALSVRRLVRRTDQAGQGAFLLCRRADAADDVSAGEHRGVVPQSRWHLRDAVHRESGDRQSDGERDRRRSTCPSDTAATRTISRTARARRRRPTGGARAATRSIP